MGDCEWININLTKPYPGLPAFHSLGIHVLPGCGVSALTGFTMAFGTGFLSAVGFDAGFFLTAFLLPSAVSRHALGLFKIGAAATVSGSDSWKISSEAACLTCSQ